ncbi:AAA family ATPase [Qiania dongpingensis]|uniref:AAA family ATPase n=1 Tax=Qiania dongpingensis TaxID=2763669 RepID=A0A7G9G483_9FIRM|nr:AAA family ATPase [Qiania dongpingensis]QNM05615.1 AAA family ATPase [Qiania dongpingensis]
MKQIRIAVYDLDAVYTERFCQYMGERYGQTAEFCPVYERNELDGLIAARSVDVVLTADALREEYPPFIGDIHVGYFTAEVSEEPGKIFRFQSCRELFHGIEMILDQEDTAVKTVAFIGANAAVGTSTAAAAYAMRLAAEEKRVLYINMSDLGDTGSIFQGVNPKDFQFLLTEMKAGADIDAAMSAALNRDSSGVYFYDNADAPLSIMDIEEGRVAAFLRMLKERGDFRYLIIDSSFSVNHGLFAALGAADKVVVVNDGTFVSNQRFHKIWTLMKRLDLSTHPGICQKTALLYNKFHSQYGKRYENPEIAVAGSIEVLPPAGTVQMAEQMARLEVLQEILR